MLPITKYRVSESHRMLLEILFNEIDEELENDILEFINEEIAVEEDNLYVYFEKISIDDILYWLDEYGMNWNPSSGIYGIIIDEIRYSPYCEKLWLELEIKRWMTEHNGKTPCRDDMKEADGFPSAYQFQKWFNTTKWNDILTVVGIQPNNQFWTYEEERFIKENWNVMSDDELAFSLNKTTSGIRYKRNELELFRQKQKQTWLKWEIEFLQANFLEGEKESICEMLAPRKWETIRAYATKILKLKRQHRLYKYQIGKEKRKCKKCIKVYPESVDFFYKDRKGYRTMCIDCYNMTQERLAREKGVMTRKLIREKFEKGQSYCGKCNNWKSVYDFRNNFNDLNQLHRWCEECEKKYLKEYYLKNKYGENYEEMYFEEKQFLFDLNGCKWDSEDERDIANWLINNQFDFERGPYYKDVFEGEFSKRRFDWKLFVNKEIYFVEYFGWWNCYSNSERIIRYTKKAKKKLKKLYKHRHKYNFIVIFPCDLNKKDLSQIFSKKSF
ncbi:hypothetical protein [Cytobacillus praedii]|uniref:hypothetical protein n=1 Tax=Cytobacillus praedii TaxID=1742358 RepID=UPI000709273D|nr:hypothetical protein [Cytobacillus praedii]